MELLPVTNYQGIVFLAVGCDVVVVHFQALDSAFVLEIALTETYHWSYDLSAVILLCRAAVLGEVVLVTVLVSVDVPYFYRSVI